MEYLKTEAKQILGTTQAFSFCIVTIVSIVTTVTIVTVLYNIYS